MQEFVVGGDEYSADMQSAMHKAIQKVTYDYENLKANTAIATLMSLVNDFYNKNKVNKAEMKTFLILLNPSAPHITEEIWQSLGFKGYLHNAKWPDYDESKLIEDTIEIPVQINGKLRGVIEVAREAKQDEIKQVIEANKNITSFIDGKTIVKEIYVPNKIYTIVVK